jgi:hypothetical protein
MIQVALRSFAEDLTRESRSHAWTGDQHKEYRKQMRDEARQYLELAGMQFIVRAPRSALRQEGGRVLLTSCGYSFATYHTDQCFRKEGA